MRTRTHLHRPCIVFALWAVTSCGRGPAQPDGVAPGDVTQDAVAWDDVAPGLDSVSLDSAGYDAPSMDVAPADTPPIDTASTDVRAGDATTDTGPTIVDPSTLTDRLIMGYQGWFAALGDGSRIGHWVHWSRMTQPSATNVTFDAWPDLTEWADTETYATGFTYADGRVARLYSAYDARTVDRHFQWMQTYGIDGVWLQRFISELGDPRFYDFRDRVTENVRAAAEARGRVFAIEYDISGSAESTLVATLQADWMHLVDTLRVTASGRYLRHRGRPVLAIWGLGFTDRPGTPAQANAIIDWFTRDAPVQYRVTLVGGVPSRWRTLQDDSRTDPAWAAVYRRFHVIHPWMVGRFATDADVVNYRRTFIEPDIAEARRVGAEYMPVIFPGFSWANLMPGQPLNQIPRRGGAFWWRQLFEFRTAGCTMFFGAMFDEVDEGTAMFKIAPTRAQSPRERPFLTLDADGMTLPSDWYLRLAGAGTRVLRGELPLTATIPIRP